MLDYAKFSPCDYADALEREHFLDYSVKPLHNNMKRIAGPTFTVHCAPGDHLMLHAAIYRAKPGDIIAVQAHDTHALAGGNVCAIAQKLGVAGFVLDGLVRDIAQIRDMGFPVFARGVMAKPGKKAAISPLNQSIVCAGAKINAGDIIVADEEGIAVIPADTAPKAYEIAQNRALSDAALSLDEWQMKHQVQVDKRLNELGFTD